MRGAGGVLRGMSLERVEPFWFHMSTYKLQKSLEMGNFGIDRAAKGDQGGMRGRGDRGGVRRSARAHVS